MTRSEKARRLARLLAVAVRAVVRPASSVFPFRFLKQNYLLRFGTVRKRVFRLILNRLITPLRPTLPGMSGKKFQIWPRRAFLNDFVQLVRLARMLPFPG
jgi:hypothetical protein